MSDTEREDPPRNPNRQQGTAVTTDAERPKPQRKPAAGNPGETDQNPQPRNPLMPTLADMDTVADNIASNAVATASVVQEILDELKAANRTAGPKDLLSLAWACYNNGSSRYVTLDSSSPNGILHSSMKDVVEQHCSLRQFCSYYAKTVYNLGKAKKKPPLNWLRKGFKEESKYAAFDFFNAVLNDASPTPPGGMKYTPTAEEIAAASVNAKFAIAESRQQPNQFSTRGNMLAMQQVQTPPPPPMITFT